MSADVEVKTGNGQGDNWQVTSPAAVEVKTAWEEGVWRSCDSVDVGEEQGSLIIILEGM